MNMSAWLVRVFVLAGCAAAIEHHAVVMDVNQTLGSLPPHPRIRLNDAGLEKLKSTINSDPLAQAIFNALEEYGETLLLVPVQNCTSGADLLMTARNLIDITYTESLLYRLTKNETFANRAIAEMVNLATTCETWDPFGLALAETVHGMSVGYDWLFDVISEEDKKKIVNAVQKLGMEEAQTQYTKNLFWTNCAFNWNVVCNGGLSIGALGFFEEFPDLAQGVLNNATKGLPFVFDSFAPDGGWHEGTMYWAYVSMYATATIETFESALGTDHGLRSYPGFNLTADYRLHATGPSRRPFNYADSDDSDRSIVAPSSLFLGYSKLTKTSLPASHSDEAGTSHSDLYSYLGRRTANSSGVFGPAVCANFYADCAKMLLDFSNEGSYADLAEQPTAKVFRLSAFGWDGRAALGFIRSAWGPKGNNNGTEAWVAFKAGNGLPNHNDLDGGSFVMEMGGERFSVDLGGDSYQLPGYWDQYARPGARYSYYRKSTVGHNTLTFNNDDDTNICETAQDPSENGVTEISLFKADATGSSPAYSIINLSAAYNAQGAKRVERGIAFTKEYEQMLVIDEVEFPGADNTTWGMHTLAEVKLDSENTNHAVLTLGKVELHVVVVEPSSSKITFKDIQLAPPQKPSPGLRKLVVVTDTSKVSRTIVSLSLSSTAAGKTPSIRPLRDWSGNGPF